MCQRRALREAGIKTEEKLGAAQDERKTHAYDDEDNRCTVSNKICYLSLVRTCRVIFLFQPDRMHWNLHDFKQPTLNSH